MRFGVNYTPSRHWWHAWLDFEPDDIRRDLDAVAALGLDHIRVFPIWPYFQPNRGVVRQRAVADLVTLVRIAGERGLDVAVDALQGHLSSFEFLPSWTQTWHRGNVFTDPRIVDGQVRLVTALAGALRDEPNFLGLTIGNEPNNMVATYPVTADEVDSWLDRLLAAGAEAAPGHPHCHCAYDAVWYTDGHPFTPRAAATKGAMTCVHPWVFSEDCARRYGPRSTEVHHLAEYVVELARGFAVDPDRMTWVQELGAPEPHIPAADAPAFVAAALHNIATCERIWGVTWWCSHDVDRRYLDYPDLEYSLGLIDTANRTKPVGREVARTVAALRAEPPALVARTRMVKRDGGRATWAPGGALFEEWMRLAAGGVRAAISALSGA